MSRNVIGVLPGAKRPDEYILYTGHWDHLGRCTPVAGDDICNGAVDNASGIAGLVTLAQAFHKAGAPDRSIVFLRLPARNRACWVRNIMPKTLSSRSLRRSAA
jgi:Zn-dependent M28 family amino/carboxypeptidase